MSQYGLGPNATTLAPVSVSSTVPLFNDAPGQTSIDMGRKRAKSRACRRVKGGGCLCNGRFARRSRCR